MFRFTTTIIAAALAWCLLANPAAAAPSVIINEVMWMGSSASASDEWLELSNLTDQPVDLSNWVLTKKSSGVETPMLLIPSGSTIPAHGFFTIANYAESSANSRLAIVPDLVDADVSLVNSALQLKLYDAAGVLVDLADDGSGAPLAGQYESGAVWKSMERNFAAGDGSLKSSWHTASASIGFDVGAVELGTPGSSNSNQPPVITWLVPDDVGVTEFTAFDASETTDPDGDPLTFTWSFGDGSEASGPTPTHQFLSTGTFTIALAVSDGQSESRVQQALSVTASEAPPSIPTSTSTPEPASTPAPTTSSPASKEKSVATVFKDADGKVLLTMLLPNPAGSDADGEVIELLNVDDHALDLRGWSVTDTTTTYTFREATLLAPNERLTLDRATTRIALNNTGEQVFLLRPDGSRANGVKYGAAREGARFVRQGTSVHWRWEGVDAIEEEDDRDVWEGVVTSLPSAFSRQWFTLQADRGAIQVYASTGRFPKLALGMQVRVTGTFAQLTAGPRLRIASPDDIAIQGTSDATPEQVAVSDLREQDVFRFVTVSGALTRGNGRQLLLTDGTGDISVVLPTGMPKPKLTTEVQGSVRGIVTLTASGIVIRLRDASDLTLTPEVLGATTVGAAAVPPPTPAATSAPVVQSAKQSLLVYGLIGLACLALAGWLAWRRRRTPYLLEDDDSPD